MFHDALSSFNPKYHFYKKDLEGIAGNCKHHLQIQHKLLKTAVFYCILLLNKTTKHSTCPCFDKIKNESEAG